MLKGLDVLAFLVYCMIIYWLSDQPSLPVLMVFTFQDKVQHFGAYFIMAILAWRSFRYVIKPSSILIIASIVFCSLFGVSDEWHQSFVGGRSPDALDWVADSLGAMVAMLVFARFYPIQKLV